MTTRADLINLIRYATPEHVATEKLEEIAADYLTLAEELRTERANSKKLAEDLVNATERITALQTAGAILLNLAEQEWHEDQHGEMSITRASEIIRS